MLGAKNTRSSTTVLPAGDDARHFTASELEALQQIDLASNEIMSQNLQLVLTQEFLLQLLWARQLSSTSAAALWQRHLDAVQRLQVDRVSDESVRKAYSAGFCVRAGADVDGRPMIWIRASLSEPATMSAALIVRNTWLAQDALLRGNLEANRRGICFVYDLLGVGLKNVRFDPQALAAVLCGATSHPSHISRVWLLDGPRVFNLAWLAGKHVVPHEVREVIRFTSTTAGKGRSFAQICPQSELPVYVGGDPARFGQPFEEWMFEQLAGKPLAYRTQDPGTTAVPFEGMSGDRCFHGASLKRNGSEGSCWLDYQLVQQCFVGKAGA